ncbi:glycoside hydrolase family 10 protein [Lignipirellula cremea]|uniref:Glycosyl hydrolase-like 10 domain-containing protein n=1 Tax=Lignipirellula cremea TaxID=2528010 RepID=A0A518DYU7_9BACT|nr:hypothetical protein [Lignipirellula cremea]QDU97022.1 hypothetical protein Pla8534_48470 [Lignipirellula cremea]
MFFLSSSCRLRLLLFPLLFPLLVIALSDQTRSQEGPPRFDATDAALAGKLISDLTCALPRTAWTDADSNVHKPIAAPPAGRWRIIDYTSQLYPGRALMTTTPDSATVTIPLNRTGWHAVSIGMSERQWEQAAVEVRLTGDKHWQLLRHSAGKGWGGPLFEEPWRFADLTGKQLEVRYPRDLNAMVASFRDKPIVASIYSVRTTPVTPEHVKLLQEPRHRPLVYINDGFGIFYNAPEPGPQIVKQALAGFADSDWDVAAFGNIGGDLVNFPAAAGTLAGKDGWDFRRPGDRRCAENLAAMIAAGEDPLQQAIDQAHAQQQKLWMYLRPQAYTAEPPYDHILRSEFFAAHPELRCEESDGSAVSKLSLAYPAVRKNLNAVLAEALKRDADGLTIAFVRGYPCVRYEEPVRALFRERYGVDPRRLPDSDPRLRLLWAELVTGWLKEVRQMLDEAGPTERSARRELAVIVGPDLDWNMRFGFDVFAWAQAGLVDVVMPYAYVEDGEINVREFAQAIEGTKVRLLPSLGTYQQNVTIAETRRRAHRYYAAGADGLSRWDCYSQWARLRLDDPVRQQLWLEHYFPPQHIKLTEFAGQNLKAFGPMLGF